MFWQVHSVIKNIWDHFFLILWHFLYSMGIIKDNRISANFPSVNITHIGPNHVFNEYIKNWIWIFRVFSQYHSIFFHRSHLCTYVHCTWFGIEMHICGLQKTGHMFFSIVSARVSVCICGWHCYCNNCMVDILKRGF